MTDPVRSLIRQHRKLFGRQTKSSSKPLQPRQLIPGYHEFVPYAEHEDVDPDTQVHTSALCSKCEPFQARLAGRWRPNDGQNDTKPSHETIVYHHLRIRELKQSALGGCRLCALLWCSLQDEICCNGYLAWGKWRTKLFNQRVHINALINTTGIGQNGVKPFLPDFGLSTAFYLSLEAHPASQLDYTENSQLRSSRSLTTKSLATMEMAKGWITECEQHSQCAFVNRSFLPTRLVDVESLSAESKIQIVGTCNIHDYPP